MDSTNTTGSDDQELAKVLESMNQNAGGSAPAPISDITPGEPATTSDGLAFEETPTPDGIVDDAAAVTDEPAPEVEALVEEPAPVLDPPTLSDTSDLDGIKKSALEELRPLVDKLDLPSDEKFDTLLLIIRSTDDKSLVGAAHEAARGISDEAKRAQALLDVIKEIDYFSGHGQQPA